MHRVGWIALDMLLMTLYLHLVPGCIPSVGTNENKEKRGSTLKIYDV